MHIFSNSTMAMLERTRNNFEKRNNVQGFGTAFQHVVQYGLRRIAGFEDVFINSGAGQPDIFNAAAGFEVKTTSNLQLAFEGNYQTIRRQFLQSGMSFRIAVLRVDALPYRFWLLDATRDSPDVARLTDLDVPGYPVDARLETALAENIEMLLDTMGTRFSDVGSPTEASAVLREFFPQSTELEQIYGG